MSAMSEVSSLYSASFRNVPKPKSAMIHRGRVTLLEEKPYREFFVYTHNKRDAFELVRSYLATIGVFPKQYSLCYKRIPLDENDTVTFLATQPGGHRYTEPNVK